MLDVLGMIGCEVVELLLHLRVMLVFVAELVIFARLEWFWRHGRWEDMTKTAILISSPIISCIWLIKS